MHLNDKIQQLKQYFSNERLKKVKDFFSSPYIPITAGAIMLFVVNPWYVQKEYDKQIGQPLREIQQEYFRREEIRMQKEGELILQLVKDQIKFEEEMKKKKKSEQE